MNREDHAASEAVRVDDEAVADAHRQHTTIRADPGIAQSVVGLRRGGRANARSVSEIRVVSRIVVSPGEAAMAFGEEVVTNLCSQLVEQGAPGLHFYTLNRDKPSLAIWSNLGLGTP